MGGFRCEDKGKNYFSGMPEIWALLFWYAKNAEAGSHSVAARGPAKYGIAIFPLFFTLRA